MPPDAPPVRIHVERQRRVPGKTVLVVASHDPRLDADSRILGGDRDTEIRHAVPQADSVDDLPTRQTYREHGVSCRDVGVAVGGHACNTAGRAGSIAAGGPERHLPLESEARAFDPEPERDPALVAAAREDEKTTDV